ncbi:O-antigen ligase [Anaeroplasma bactoclasticum]|uniref:O-antigen ligase n=1 Tax=Anaeroplasma bactoclasticum TaxID=2088 RepID=A0A397RVN6_9MOLU|nr:hypothetical protein [Anaeroplasma bactoclasticum]RIA78410.1 O-antigen ligase [Anaeroplasma bactoclasticum]
MIKEKWEAISNNFKRFSKTTYFIIMLSLLTLFSYFLDITAVGYITFTVILFLLLLFDCDFSSFIPMIFLWFGGYRTNTWQIPSPPFVIVLIMYGICLILFIYRIIKNYKIYYKRLKKDYIFISLVLILVSMALSLINTPDLALSGLGISHFIIILLSYTLIKMTVEINDKSRNFIIKSILITGLMISIQAFSTLILALNSGDDFYSVLCNRELNLGYMHPNHYAAFLNIGCILAVYYFCKNRESIFKRIIATTCLLVFSFISLLTASRGGGVTYAITIVLVVVVYLTYTLRIKKYNMLKDLYYLIPFFVLGITGIIVLGCNGILGDIIHRFLNSGSSLSGRDSLYLIAIEKFKLHSLIGNGVYTTRLYFSVWNYHNYILQMLGTCGALGLLAFLFYLYASITRSLRWRSYSVFSLIVILYFLIHGLFDTTYFHHLLMPIILALQAVEYENNINLFEIQYSDILIRNNNPLVEL